MTAHRGNRLTEVLRTLEQEALESRRVSHRFGKRGEFGLRVASTTEDRLAAWRLAYRVYREKEYAAANAPGLWYSIHDALPATTTVLAEQDGRVIGAVTVVGDSPLGLPADATFPAETARLRGGSKRLAEAVSLVQACESERAGMLVIAKLCEFTCLVARELLVADQLVITVNPRHESYYRKVMLFQRRGEVIDCRRVCAAPAVFLTLNFTDMERHIARATQPGTPRTLYRRFMPAPEWKRLANGLRRRKRSLGPSALRRFFFRERKLLQELSPAQLRHLAAAYPGCDFRGITKRREKHGTRELEAVS